MAGTEVGSLYYDLDIDDSKLSASLEGADKQVKNFGDSVGDSGEKLKASLNKAATGFAVAGAGLGLISKNALDFTVDLVKSSKTLGREIGVSTEEASRLTAAFNRMGVEADSARQMFGVFSKNIVAAGEATEKTDTAFKKLGVSTKNSAGVQKDFTTILFEVADKFKSLPGGIDKTALSMELFGRQGKDMIKVLDLGSQGIQDLEKRADELGLTLNSNTITKINALVQSQKRLKEQTDSLKISIGTATAPLLTSFNQALADVTATMLSTDMPLHGLTAGFFAFAPPVFMAASAVLAFSANLVTAGPAILKVTQALMAMTAVTTAGWAAAIAVDFALVVAAANSVRGAFEAVYNAQNAAANLAPEAQMRELQNKGIAARKAGDAAGAAKYARAVAALAGNAEGTDNWRGGATWVGEKGPEIVNLPRGSQVIPNRLSEKMVKSGGGNSTSNTTFNIGTIQDRADADYIIRRIDRSQQRLSMGMSPL